MDIVYEKAYLIKGKREWYIKYYQTNPSTGQKQRFRPTFNLNRIKDLAEREDLALKVIKDINAKLPYGWPFENQFKGLPSRTNVLKALLIAEKICATSDRKNTNRNYRSIVNIFSRFLHIENLTELSISEITKSHAVAFLDYALFERQIANRTYNNYLERLKKFWTELKKRQYVSKNIWKKFKKRKPGAKSRRAFSKKEKRIVIDVVANKDPWLLLGILLQYYCFIRPVEIRRLRFHMIDINLGLIKLTGNETKNRENAIVTIPDALVPFLRDFKFERWDEQWLIFGEGGLPHPNKACSHDLLNSRHRSILLKLHKTGKLSNIKGLSFYSWKDTGALYLFEQKVNTLEIMRQLRHKDLSTTQKYCNSLYSVNREIKNLKNSILDTYKIA